MQFAEDLWNTRDPNRVAAAYTLDYKLKKELWDFRANRMAVNLQYEWHDDDGRTLDAHPPTTKDQCSSNNTGVALSH